MTMSIGTMGVKLLDGGMPVGSILMQNLVSWESVDNTHFRLTVKQEGKKKPIIHDFVTNQGPEICECMLEFAKKLAEERRKQAKAAKSAKAARKDDEEATTKSGARGAQAFDVTQTYYKKFPSDSIHKGKKISEGLVCEISQTSILLRDGYITVADIPIQTLLSWETITDDKFKLVIKPEKEGGTKTEIVFGTPQANDITDMLLQKAKDLAVVKKQQKAEKKRRAKEAEVSDATHHGGVRVPISLVFQIIFVASYSRPEPFQ